MKKILIILVCLLLLVSCKQSNNDDKNGEPTEENIINVKTDKGNWAKVNETLIDSLNNKEIIGEYSISVPDWKSERKDDSILYEKNDIVLIMLYKNTNYTDKKISNYNKSNNKKLTINSFKVEYEEGSVSYSENKRNYISYYLNDNNISIKLIGISKEKNIKELDDMIKSMIESLFKETN